MSEGWLILKDGDRQVKVAVASDGAATWVFFDGGVWRIENPAGEGRTRVRARGDTSVMSPMPATVVSINTLPGQAVQEGETVIVLEAMKMELPIKAPRGGIVKAIHCARGELVQPGVNLLEIE